jgi:hypothetical protein
MNLNMPQPVLNRIASKGAAAGKSVEKLLLRESLLDPLAHSGFALQRHTMGVRRQRRAATQNSGLCGRYQLVKAIRGRAFLQVFLAGKNGMRHRSCSDNWLQRARSGKISGPDLSQESPRPLPQMRIVPTY